MVNKKKYYELDDIGFIGTQEKVSPATKKRIERLTGDLFRAAKTAKSSKPAKTVSRRKAK